MKRTPLLLLGLAVTFGLALPVAAQQGMMGGPDAMMGGMMGQMMGGMMGGHNSFAMRLFDANKDGTLTPEEMTMGMQGEIKTYDTDKSGSLSLAEFAVMHAAHTRTMMVRAFQMHDEDGDGQVTEAEMAAMATMMQMMTTGPSAGPGMHGAAKDGMADDN